MPYHSREEQREKEEAKAAQRRRRKGYAPLKAALPLAPKIETIQPGIKERTSKATGEMQIFPTTFEAKAEIREQCWILSGQKCGLCAKPIYEMNWDMHHIKQLSLGGDWSQSNLMAVCKYPGNPFIGAISCHELLHRTDLIEKKFAHDPVEKERYLRLASGQREVSE